MDKKSEINNEIRKFKYQKDEAIQNLNGLKENYRNELVNECVENLYKLLKDEGELTKRDLEIYIKNMSHDVRNLYKEN